jgi:YebC/PmpR family DNA-binding regulatory protein
MGRWGSIKYKKAASDAKRGINMGRYSREILRATQVGGADVAMNFRLRAAIEKAKQGGLPAEKIEHAIAKGSGALKADGLEDVVYEGYGPAGTALLIETATENRNRTAGDIRSYFNKCHGNLGQDGCVAYLFEPLGYVAVAYNTALLGWETLAEWAIEAGADDVIEPCSEWQDPVLDAAEEPPAPLPNGWERLVVLCPPAQLNAVCQALQPQLTPGTAHFLQVELTRKASTTAVVSDETDQKHLLKLLELLEEHEDVQQVYCNAAWPPEA